MDALDIINGLLGTGIESKVADPLAVLDNVDWKKHVRTVVKEYNGNVYIATTGTPAPIKIEDKVHAAVLMAAMQKQQGAWFALATGSVEGAIQNLRRILSRELKGEAGKQRYWAKVTEEECKAKLGAKFEDIVQWFMDLPAGNLVWDADLSQFLLREDTPEEAEAKRAAYAVKDNLPTAPEGGTLDVAAWLAPALKMQHERAKKREERVEKRARATTGGLFG